MLVTPLVSQTSARGPFSHLAASDMPSKKIATKNRNGKWNEHRVDARDAGSTFRIAQPPRRAPTHFNATGTSTVLRGNALELIESQRDIRADLIGGNWEPPPRHGLSKIGDYVRRTFVYRPEHAHLR